VDEREFARSMTEHANLRQAYMRGMSDEAAKVYVRKIVADNGASGSNRLRRSASASIRSKGGGLWRPSHSRPP
jgi:hypothetical protein